MSCSISSVLKVVQGSTLDLVCHITDQTSKLPIDLTGLATTDITAKFKKTDGTALSKTIGSGVTVSSAVGGKILISLSTSDTTLLLEDEYQSFEVIVVKAGKTYKKIFEKALTVVADIF